MFDQYVKIFNISWIEPWIVEAMGMMIGGLVLGLVICKAIECFDRDKE
jgi:putative effector of murein hydrolase LrgA (UPF0299 family)